MNRLLASAAALSAFGVAIAAPAQPAEIATESQQVKSVPAPTVFKQGHWSAHASIVLDQSQTYPYCR